jgi:uncharacterized membrane protein
MGTGKQRISTAVRLEAKAEGGPVLELQLVLVQAELALAQVAVPELELGRAAEQGLGQVAAEQVLAPVVAVAVPDHPRARLGVALRTKSVIALHRRGLPRLAVEELAAVAETTHEPAATEAAVAWAAAVTVAAAALDIAVVVAAVVVAPELAVVVAEAEEAADVAEEDAGGNQLTNQ